MTSVYDRSKDAVLGEFQRLRDQVRSGSVAYRAPLSTVQLHGWMTQQKQQEADQSWRGLLKRFLRQAVRQETEPTPELNAAARAQTATDLGVKGHFLVRALTGGGESLRNFFNQQYYNVWKTKLAHQEELKQGLKVRQQTLQQLLEELETVQRLCDQKVWQCGESARQLRNTAQVGLETAQQTLKALEPSLHLNLELTDDTFHALYRERQQQLQAWPDSVAKAHEYYYPQLWQSLRQQFDTLQTRQIQAGQQMLTALQKTDQTPLLEEFLKALPNKDQREKARSVQKAIVTLMEHGAQITAPYPSSDTAMAWWAEYEKRQRLWAASVPLWQTSQAPWEGLKDLERRWKTELNTKVETLQKAYERWLTRWNDQFVPLHSQYPSAALDTDTVVKLLAQAPRNWPSADDVPAQAVVAQTLPEVVKQLERRLNDAQWQAFQVRVQPLREQAAEKDLQARVQAGVRALVTELETACRAQHDAIQRVSSQAATLVDQLKQGWNVTPSPDVTRAMHTLQQEGCRVDLVEPPLTTFESHRQRLLLTAPSAGSNPGFLERLLGTAPAEPIPGFLDWDKSRYRKLSRLLHPDKVQDPALKKIREQQITWLNAMHETWERYEPVLRAQTVYARWQALNVELEALLHQAEAQQRAEQERKAAAEKARAEARSQQVQLLSQRLADLRRRLDSIRGVTLVASMVMLDQEYHGVAERLQKLVANPDETSLGSVEQQMQRLTDRLQQTERAPGTPLEQNWESAWGEFLSKITGQVYAFKGFTLPSSQEAALPGTRQKALALVGVLGLTTLLFYLYWRGKDYWLQRKMRHKLAQLKPRLMTLLIQPYDPQFIESRHSPTTQTPGPYLAAIEVIRQVLKPSHPLSLKRIRIANVNRYGVQTYATPDVLAEVNRLLVRELRRQGLTTSALIDATAEQADFWLRKNKGFLPILGSSLDKPTAEKKSERIK